MSGEIKVDLTVNETAIEDVNIDVSCESIMFGKMAGPHLKDEILAKQSADVDAITGATTTSKAVIEATKEALSKAEK
ncbi:FMN-binding protein [Lactobacillus sp. PV034]|nr:FMN-binding protein [Lactobacillus sp. PV034]